MSSRHEGEAVRRIVALFLTVLLGGSRPGPGGVAGLGGDDHDADRRPVRRARPTREGTRSRSRSRRAATRRAPTCSSSSATERRRPRSAGTRRSTATSARRPRRCIADAGGVVTFPAADPNFGVPSVQGCQPAGPVQLPGPRPGVAGQRAARLHELPVPRLDEQQRGHGGPGLPDDDAAGRPASTAAGLHRDADGAGTVGTPVQLLVHRDHGFAGADVHDEPDDRSPVASRSARRVCSRGHRRLRVRSRSR